MNPWRMFGAVLRFNQTEESISRVLTFVVVVVCGKGEIMHKLGPDKIALNLHPRLSELLVRRKTSGVRRLEGPCPPQCLEALLARCTDILSACCLRTLTSWMMNSADRLDGGSSETSPLLGKITSRSYHRDGHGQDSQKPSNNEETSTAEEPTTSELLLVMGSIWVGCFLAALDSTIS